MFKLGMLELAEEDFRFVSSEKPKKSYGHFNYALTLFQKGDYKKTITILDKIIKLSYSYGKDDDDGKKRVDNIETEEDLKKAANTAAVSQKAN